MEEKIIETNKKKRYKCSYPECEATFVRPNRLQRHLNLHTGQRPYKCTIESCYKSYTNSSHLKRHLETHAAVAKRYECTHCLSSMSTLSNLKRHYKRAHNSDRELYCHTCNVKFRKKSRYEEHMSSHENSSLYKCDKCGKMFKMYIKLRKHQLSHKSKNYQCPFKDCSKIFEKWAPLVKHRQLEHETKYQCPKCDKIFLKKSSLKSHDEIHKKNRPVLPCPYATCKRLYYFKRNLNVHIRRYHINRKFICDICGSALSSKQKIRFHIRMHETAGQADKGRKTAQSKRYTGAAKKSTLSMLIGINLLGSVERKLSRRIPKALLRDEAVKESSHFSEGEGASNGGRLIAG